MLAWVLVFVGPISSVFYENTVAAEVVWYIGVVILVLLIVFYINFSLLIPRFLFRKKFVSYVVSVMVLLGSVFLVNTGFRDRYNIERHNERLMLVDKEARLLKLPPQGKPPHRSDNEEMGENHRPPPHGDPSKFHEGKGIRPQMRQLPPPFIFAPYFALGAVFLFFILGIAIRTTTRWYDEDRKNKQISAEQLKTELAFLKNQISPHFFFNTLNNIYALTESNPEQAKEITYKLSKLMRYLLYESDKNQNVCLDKEISFMENYIDLMRPRLSENVKVVTRFGSDRLKDRIPPLLFITFVENAFKHGLSSNKLSYIDISLQNINGRVVFKVENSIPGNDNVEKGVGGLGLVNIKRRLELLFDKGAYSLKINETNETFSVELNIPANGN